MPPALRSITESESQTHWPLPPLVGKGKVAKLVLFCNGLLQLPFGGGGIETKTDERSRDVSVDLRELPNAGIPSGILRCLLRLARSKSPRIAASFGLPLRRTALRNNRFVPTKAVVKMTEKSTDTVFPDT